jgi:Diadenosine tetraphosphate (Ap4A) hydrolase and other HIT family hydrolases
MTTQETIFSKIIRREIPADIVYEDDLALAFRDVHPQAPIHIILIPKKPIPKLADAESGDHALMGHLLLTVKRVAEQLGLSNGYRVVINNGGRWRPDCRPSAPSHSGRASHEMASGLKV